MGRAPGGPVSPGRPAPLCQPLLLVGRCARWANARRYEKPPRPVARQRSGLLTSRKGTRKLGPAIARPPSGFCSAALRKNLSGPAPCAPLRGRFYAPNGRGAFIFTAVPSLRSRSLRGLPARLPVPGRAGRLGCAHRRRLSACRLRRRRRCGRPLLLPLGGGAPGVVFLRSASCPARSPHPRGGRRRFCPMRVSRGRRRIRSRFHARRP